MTLDELAADVAKLKTEVTDHEKRLTQLQIEHDRFVGLASNRLYILESAPKTPTAPTKPLSETIDEHRGKLSAGGSAIVTALLLWLAQWISQHPFGPAAPVQPPAKVAPMQEAKP